MTTYPSRAASVAAAASTTGNEVIEVVQNGALVKASLSTSFTLASGALGIATVTAGSLTSAPSLSTSDVYTVEIAGVAYQVIGSALADFISGKPRASRTSALPVTLTATDNNKTVILTGTTGNLTVDGTVADGFRCDIINNASGNANYSGITGLLSSTALATGAACRVLMGGSTVYATAAASPTPPSPASAFTVTPTAFTTANTVAGPITITPNGAWQSGNVVGLALTTVTGTVAAVSGCIVTGSGASWSVTPTPGSTSPAVVSFAPSSGNGVNGSIGFSSTGGTSITVGTASITVTVVASATSFGSSPTTISIASGATQTLTFTPSGGIWLNSQAVVLTLNTVAGTIGSVTNGTISGTGPYTITPTGGNSTAITAVYTASGGAATGTIGVAGTGLTSTNTSLTTTVTTATSFTTSPTTVAVLTGGAQTITFTPVGGPWVAGQSIGLTLNTVTGTMATVTNGTISGSGPYTVTPTVGNTSNVTVVFTGSGTVASGTIGVSGTGITSTNPSLATAISVGPPTLGSATLLEWWRSDLGVATSGTTVTSWTSQGSHATVLASPLGTTTRTSNVRNGRAAVATLGSQLSNSSAAWLDNMTGDWTMALVYDSTQSTIGAIATVGAAVGANSNCINLFATGTGTSNFQRNGSAQHALSTVAGAGSGVLTKDIITYVGSTRTMTLYRNNGTTSSGSFTPGADANIPGNGGTAWQVIAVGELGAANFSFNGNIFEVVLYSGAANSPDITTLYNYETTGWG